MGKKNNIKEGKKIVLKNTFFNNRVVVNTFIFTIYLFIIEMIVRMYADARIEISILRIFLSSFLIGLVFSWILHFFKKLPARIMSIIFVLGIGIYEFVEFGLYNYLGFYMGVGNAEQGTKVTSYIMDFLKSLKFVHWLIFIPIVLFVVYYVLIDRRLMKHKERNKKFNMVQKVYIEIVTFIFIIAVGALYYGTIRWDKMQDELQTESNYSLWLYPENSNLTVNNFGVLMYGFADIKSTILGISEEDVYNLEELKEEPKKEVEKPVITDYTRKIDDTAWNKLIDNTSDSTFKTLNNYFINRDITPKNDMTGIFEDKNLIIILMESVNEISILNKEDFPTLYKLYNEGISFRNNFSPRNNCSTGNNEFTVLSSLFTINNTCTANTYAKNKYFEGAFNIFNNKGYSTSSYHDYTQKYYRRGTIHPNLGSNKFYGVTDLGMTYNEKYEEWPSDVDMFKSAQKHYMNEDKFMAYFASVSTHQTYNVSSELGDKYKEDFKKKGYSTNLSRYLSKMKTFDEAMEELLMELESSGKLENTVIAMFGDHYPYGLTGGEINEYLKANNASYTVNRNSTKDKDVDRTPLIIYNSKTEPKIVEDYTTIVDLLPTLLNMFNMDYDPRLYLGTDVFSDSHKSRAVFADGSWQDDRGFYYSPNNKITYKKDAKEYTSSELKSINQEISTRQKMSATAIKSNYFNYLGNGLEKYKPVVNNVEDQESE